MIILGCEMGRYHHVRKHPVKLGGGDFKYVLAFSPRKFGEDEAILTSIFFRIFSDGLVQPPTRVDDFFIFDIFLKISYGWDLVFGG